MLRITEKEKQELAELRISLADILETEEDAHRKTDAFLTTWLRHKGHNLPNVEKAFRKHTIWRKEHKIDTIHTQVFGDLSRLLTYELEGFDKENRPVIWVPFGKWNLLSLVDGNNSYEKFYPYSHQFCQNIELAIIKEYNKVIQKNGELVWQFTGVFDLAGFSFRQLLSPTVIKLLTHIATIGEAHWPLRCGSLVVINAPSVVTVLLNILKPILSETTKSGIKIYGSNREEWEKALANHIENEYIPTFYGGNRTSLIIK